ncbi:MAG: beta-lactamase domain protein, partial [Bryobacterales bacterium]|nr:beta-lactamase domain protein [Bryobacterales bacterium]
APSGESMLFDAGWPASPARPASTDRIVEVAKAAGLKRIDNVVISHFDTDHIGDVPQLASKFPVGRIYDHGDAQANNPQAKQRFAAYSELREKYEHRALKAGDKIPVKGLDIEVLSSGGKFISAPLKNAGAGAKNPLCDTTKQADIRATDFEDDQSLGLLIRFGKFRMLDLADLEAHYSRDLVCPANLIGTVDLYNVNVHGQFKGIAPELAGAIAAPVMIQANGARKGADAQTWPVLRATPGLKDVWQLHLSVSAGNGANPPEDLIANLEPPAGSAVPDTFKWLQISAASDGTFTVTNTRNGFSRKYKRQDK